MEFIVINRHQEREINRVEAVARFGGLASVALFDSAPNEVNTEVFPFLEMDDKTDRIAIEPTRFFKTRKRIPNLTDPCSSGYSDLAGSRSLTGMISATERQASVNGLSMQDQLEYVCDVSFAGGQSRLAGNRRGRRGLAQCCHDEFAFPSIQAESVPRSARCLPPPISQSVLPRHTGSRSGASVALISPQGEG